MQPQPWHAEEGQPDGANPMPASFDEFLALNRSLKRALVSRRGFRIEKVFETIIHLYCVDRVEAPGLILV